LIEGYGAIFMLNVNFPLAGTTEKTNDADVKERTSSPWDETKNELYGGPSEGHSVKARREFNPAQLENLKKALIGALKNASNIRNLKSDESVTVVVSTESGGSSARFFVHTDQKGKFGGDGGFGGSGGGSSASGTPPPPGVTWIGSPNSGHQSSSPTLTIRAKKSDIDAFSKGKLNLEEFRNKVAVLLY
jgi:hypothetical protein